MKLVILALLCLLLLSCGASQQVIEIASSKVPITNGFFTSENDTLSISYDFWEYHGQMKFTVYNKLSVPVYIDWKNAGFIVNDQSMPYYRDASESKTKGTSTSYYYYGVQSSGTSTTTTVKSERITTLLPHSKITRLQYRLYTGYQLSPNNMTRTPITDKVKGYVKNYEATATPQHFRNFLMYATSEDMHNSQQVDDEFYFSKLMVVKTADVSRLSGYTRFYITDARLKIIVGKQYN